jgi:hypothetical protein
MRFRTSMVLVTLFVACLTIAAWSGSAGGKAVTTLAGDE